MFDLLFFLSLATSQLLTFRQAAGRSPRHAAASARPRSIGLPSPKATGANRTPSPWRMEFQLQVGSLWWTSFSWGLFTHQGYKKTLCCAGPVGPLPLTPGPKRFPGGFPHSPASGCLKHPFDNKLHRIDPASGHHDFSFKLYQFGSNVEFCLRTKKKPKKNQKKNNNNRTAEVHTSPRV